jgi:hypothetical protein
MWITYEGGQGICEEEDRTHRVDMQRHKYEYVLCSTRMAGTGAHSERRAVFTDDGIIWNNATFQDVMFETTIKAMEAEAAAGKFVPSMWAPSFPRRTAELVERYRATIAAALADELPAVLIGIVMFYLL